MLHVSEMAAEADGMQEGSKTSLLHTEQRVHQQRTLAFLL